MLKTTESHHKHFIDIPNLFLIFFKKIGKSQSKIYYHLHKMSWTVAWIRLKRYPPHLEKGDARRVLLPEASIYQQTQFSVVVVEAAIKAKISIHQMRWVYYFLLILLFFIFIWTWKWKRNQPIKIGERFSDCEVLRFYWNFSSVYSFNLFVWSKEFYPKVKIQPQKRSSKLKSLLDKFKD